jgi:hypothetical protein
MHKNYQNKANLNGHTAMRCYCCKQQIKIARKAKLRPWRELNADRVGPETAAYESYKEEMTFRWAFLCNACYRILDNEAGRAEIDGQGEFNLAGASRFAKATTVDEAGYLEFQRKEAEKMGLDAD